MMKQLLSSTITIVGVAAIGMAAFFFFREKIENLLPTGWLNALSKWGWWIAAIGFGIAAIAVLLGGGVVAGIVALVGVVAGGSALGYKASQATEYGSGGSGGNSPNSNKGCPPGFVRAAGQSTTGIRVCVRTG